HVAAGLELLAGAVPNPVPLVVVAAVVEHDDGDRRLVARHGPQRLRTAEQEAAVTDHRDDGSIGQRELDADPRRHAPAEHVGTGADIVLVGAAEGHHGIHGLAGVNVTHVTSIPIERILELQAKAAERYRGGIGAFAGGLLAHLPHLGADLAGPLGAVLGDLLEALLG